MSILLFISSLVCGGDVARLGSADFHARHDAHKRLASLGWVAYPALIRGSQSDVSERSSRCEELLDRLDGWLSLAAAIEGAANGFVPLSPDASDAFMAAVCRRLDKLGGWRTAEAWSWVKSTPYREGTRVGDCQYAINCAAAKRAMSYCFPPLVPGLK